MLIFQLQTIALTFLYQATGRESSIFFKQFLFPFDHVNIL